MRELVPMLDTPVDGMEVRLRCRRPDGVWVTLRAVTYREAVSRVPVGWTFIRAVITEVSAADQWEAKGA